VGEGAHGLSYRRNFALRNMEQLRAVDPLAAHWVVVVLLVAFGVLGWVNVVSPRKWSLLGKSFFSYRLGRQSLRDELDLQDRTLIGLLLLACASVALFGCQLAVLQGGMHGTFGLWARFFGIGVGVVATQVVLARLLAMLFQGDGGLSEYLYTVLVFHAVAGLLLLPIAGMVAFPHMLVWRTWLVWAGVGLLAAVGVFRWLRAALVGLGEGVPLRYIFIYLCALEILPVVLLLQQLRSHIIAPFPTL
jgi:Domain of unknown function (DUF4271)